MRAWIDGGLEFASRTQVSASEVGQHSPETLILDVRSDQEWDDGHIEGSLHSMLGDLPLRSSIAASLLAQHLFSNVSSMDGGMTAWNGRKLPVVRGE